MTHGKAVKYLETVERLQFGNPDHIAAVNVVTLVGQCVVKWRNKKPPLGDWDLVGEDWCRVFLAKLGQLSRRV
jgi:hypothetical protein